MGFPHSAVQSCGRSDQDKDHSSSNLGCQRLVLAAASSLTEQYVAPDERLQYVLGES